MNSDKIILDLCGGTGSWSKPYKDAGYDVRLVTLPNDVRGYIAPENVYGILAAPPCTHFSGSGAQYWKAKDEDGRTLDALSVVDACLDIIKTSRPTFWALENPIGRLRKLRHEQLGEPRLVFEPYYYGDPYTKKTLLWGDFNLPIRREVPYQKNSDQGNQISMPTLNGKKIGWHTELAKEMRSITPQGFAQAFYKANP